MYFWVFFTQTNKWILFPTVCKTACGIFLTTQPRSDAACTSGCCCCLLMRWNVIHNKSYSYLSHRKANKNALIYLTLALFLKLILIWINSLLHKKVVLRYIWFLDHNVVFLKVVSLKRVATLFIWCFWRPSLLKNFKRKNFYSFAQSRFIL